MKVTKLITTPLKILGLSIGIVSTIQHIEIFWFLSNKVNYIVTPDSFNKFELMIWILGLVGLILLLSCYIKDLRRTNE